MSSRYVDHIRVPASYLEKQKQCNNLDTQSSHSSTSSLHNDHLFKDNSPSKRSYKKQINSVQKSVEVKLDLIHPQITSSQITALPCSSNSHENGDADGNYNAWTGTIKRGNKKANGITEVQFELTDKEILKLNKSIKRDKDEKLDKQILGIGKGPHVIFWSILCVPFALIFSLAFTFYIGTITWYNIYINLSEDRTIWHKIFFCPLLIIFFPFIIPIPSIIVAIYAMFIQISWNISSWSKEWRDLEKGFFVWLCHIFKIPECVPYEIVIIDDPEPLQYDVTEEPT